MELHDERAFIDAEMEIYRVIAAGTQNSIMIEIYTSVLRGITARSDSNHRHPWGDA